MGGRVGLLGDPRGEPEQSSFGCRCVSGGLAGAGLRNPEREVVFWPRHNLFFGGVHAVRRDAQGRLDAAGDPRRGGTTAIV